MPYQFTTVAQSGLFVSQMNHFQLPKLIIRKDYLRKNGTAAINLQVIINRQKKVIPTNVYVFPHEWEPVSEKVILPKKQNEQQNAINIRLQQFKSRAINILQKYELYQKSIDINLFEREFIQADKFKDLITYINDSIPTLPHKPGTKKTYRTTLMHLTNFKQVIPFAMINVEFLREWEHYLNQKKMSVNSINKHHKVLNRFLRMAINEDIPVLNPYERYKKQPNKKVTRHYLSSDELNRLIEIYNSGQYGESLFDTLSAFLFSCLGGGYRISELKILSTENIKNDEVYFEAPKTSKTKGFRSIKLTDAARAIINNRNGKLFNLQHDNSSNRHLKVIAQMAGINFPVSFHIARHTFAMQYLINGGKVENLMHILGHSKIETTMCYVHMHDELVNQKMDIMNIYTEIKKLDTLKQLHQDF